MEITDVDIHLEDDSGGNVKAYCHLTFDGTLVVKNFKVIDGRHGLFVAMPSRKDTKECYKCHTDIPKDASYCYECGKNINGGNKNKRNLYDNMVYTRDNHFKDDIEEIVLEEYEREKGRFGVTHQADEDYDSLDFELPEEHQSSDEEERQEREQKSETTAFSINLFANPEQNLFQPPSHADVHEPTHSFKSVSGENGESQEGEQTFSFSKYY